ncbi:MAG: RNA polymerase sigma factor [Planctomycetota bacterium]
MNPEVGSLVAQCLKGQQPAFVELFARYRGMVYGLCLRMLRHREEAEDATQETFLRVARNLHRWDRSKRFEPWLLTIAGNRCRTRLARLANKPRLVNLEQAPEDRSQLQGAATLLSEELGLALETVRPEFRDAFSLFYQGELSYAEIAERMDVPLGTVKTWVHRARKELIQKLQERGTLNE